MATAAHKKAPASKAEQAEDAIVMLTTDHRKVKALFKEFEKLKGKEGSDEDKAAIVQQVCDALKVHAEIEEQMFYPAVRKAIHDNDLMDEAIVEHAGAKDLIAQLEAMEPGDDLYDAKVSVLGEEIDHHVKEEEGDMFLKARKAKVDTVELGEEMAERRMALLAELGISEQDDE
jgi:hemerythrin-like domain-containing protein